jgi:WD40 repeat protein
MMRVARAGKLVIATLGIYSLVLMAGCGAASSTAGLQPTRTPTATPTPSVPALDTALLKYTGHTQAVIGVVWSADGKHIASSSDDGTVQLWDATSGQQLWSTPAQPTKNDFKFALA